ncbi:hypothetical protein ACIBCN_41450 [Nocardia sp. NPDC051052]|uniref:hypothetical protein n=1 Tax=Nocardia sp. NPDC051052 TaxID=3364322 RepID=UPI0037885DAA
MNGPAHRSFLVVDVENSSALDNVELVRTDSMLYRLLEESIPNPEAVAAKEDRGDGVMVILDLPALDVLDHVVTGLLEKVRQYNTTVDPLDWLRIRIAVHEGYVDRDKHGWRSDALTATFRLNGTQVVKDALKHAARSQGVVIISDAVYQGVVRHGYRPTVTPAGYDGVVIGTSQGDIQAWVRVPGYPIPSLPGRQAVSTREEHRDRASNAGLPGSVTANNLIVGKVNARTIVGRDIVGGAP